MIVPDEEMGKIGDVLDAALTYVSKSQVPYRFVRSSDEFEAYAAFGKLHKALIAYEAYLEDHESE